MKSMKLSIVLGVLQLCSTAYAAELSPTRRNSAQSRVVVPEFSVFSHVPSMPSDIGDVSTPKDQEVFAGDRVLEHDQGAFLGAVQKLLKQSGTLEKSEMPPLKRRKTEQCIVVPKEEGREQSGLHSNSFRLRRNAFESEEESGTSENSVSVETKSIVPATPLMIATRLEAIIEDWE